jgi:HK97 family phage portal protein
MILGKMWNKRSEDIANPSSSFLSWMNGLSFSGKAVNEESSVSYSAVFACTNVIAETIASLPLHLYKESGNKGREKAKGKELYNLLYHLPNPDMTSFSFRYAMQLCVLLWGNAYAFIDWDYNKGEPKALYPYHPSKVEPRRDKASGKIVYDVDLGNGKKVTLSKYQVLHIMGFSFDGLKGISTISLAREAVGLGLAAEEYGSRFFSNGAKPLGVLEHPGELGEEALDHLRGSWDELHKGLHNSHKVAILEEGMTYKQIGIPPEDAQFLETRKFQLEEIARFYRVPLHLVGNLDRATFSNIEHQDLAFTKHTIRPWLVRWEQSLDWKLLTSEERKKYYAEHNADALLRGDLKSRYDAYAIGRQNGWLNGNDVREKENMETIDGLDEYLVNGNMISVQTAAKQQPKGGGNNGQEGTEE